MKKIKNRYSLLLSLASFYILISFVIRFVLYCMTFNNIEFSVLNFGKIFLSGLMFDLGSASFLTLFYSFYLFLVPKKLIGSIFDKISTYFIISILLFIIIFSLSAEFPFWDEFSTRFNFIAVDYLIYTYEVFENINESYPLPLLITGMLLAILGLIFLFHKLNIFKNTFGDKIGFLKRLAIFIPTLLLSLIYILFVKNSHAEWSKNLYENELSKNGAYSFFAAYRSNELDFNTFYQTLSEDEAFSIIKKELKQNNQHYIGKEFWDIKRDVKNDSLEESPNIILICIESFSADFMTQFGNKKNITPNIDELSKGSLFFTNLYATGTRTIRGMEALTLSVPPTPGNSIVRRPNNNDIFSIADILRQKNYHPYFIYGGDGYFDNMNTFFGGQGFTIVDRNRGNPLKDNLNTERINIDDNEVQFENAWGISDEDLYNKTLQVADKSYSQNKRFFDFVMTTSNHKPYTFPNNKIDLPQGSRNAAVKYTDYAIGQFIKNARKKPWFKNTIFIIVADHCASSAGKWEINIAKHHIPAIIYNLPHKPEMVNKLASQIDLMPTVFGLLHWNYNTALYGKDITKTSTSEERALIGNYRTLGLLQNNIFTEINDKRMVNFYSVDVTTKEMKPIKTGVDSLRNKTISYYQTASYRFKNGRMKNTK